MKKFLRILAVIVIVLIVAIAGFYFYIAAYLPNIKAPENLVVEINPERLERGNYLANSVMGCMECHAKRDFNLYAGPVIESTKGAGGERWDHSLGFPGTIYSPNITPTHLSDWSDGELYRAIAAGVGKDGEALFPIMPYHRYAKLPEEDIYAIIAYLRSLEAKPGEYPKKELDFPLSLIVNTIPAEPTHDLGPSADPVKHGEYLITAAACYDCHTMMDERGQFNEEMAYAGGMEFGLPTGGKVFASN
ncbi:MAG: hypothetical protein KDC05_03125, partial [Bacteroidales bacterium]|nr:hypothetical protein [Bacteroidales bacterium]